MENYETLGVIGEGTYGVVMRARHRETGMLVAIKKFKESDEDEQVRKTSLREVRVLKQLRHDNIITLLEVFRRKGKLYLVFEYVEKTILEVLESRPSGLDPEDVRRYMYQLLRGVQYCHLHNVMHRDIKPENILISRNGTLKLCDFGFARLQSIGGKYTDYVATRWYRSPELLVGDVEYSRAVDIWAVGCIFAEISNGMPLFPGESDVDQLAHIMRCTGRLTSRQSQAFRRNPLYVGIELPNPREQETLEMRFPNMPRTWLQFIKACLRNDPEMREDTHALMSMSYFTEGDFRNSFEQELRLLFEKEQRALHGIGTRSTNKHSSSNNSNAAAQSAQPSQNAPKHHVPDQPLPNPARDSPAGAAPPAIGKPKQQQTSQTTPPSIGSLWSQYLASVSATPSGHHGIDQLPDLGHKVQSLQTQHPLFNQPQQQQQHQPAQGMYYRSESTPSLPAKIAPHAAEALARSSETSQRNPTLSMTSTSLHSRGYQPPSSSQQASRPMFPSIGASAQNQQPQGAVANASLGLTYKKKSTKKNVLSTLNLAGSAYGPSQPSSGQTSGGYPNPYAVSGAGMMLQGQHTGTSVPPTQQGARRSGKPWAH